MFKAQCQVNSALLADRVMERKLTISQAADLAQVDKGQFGKFLRGNRPVTIGVAGRLRATFGHDVIVLK